MGLVGEVVTVTNGYLASFSEEELVTLFSGIGFIAIGMGLLCIIGVTYLVCRKCLYPQSKSENAVEDEFEQRPANLSQEMANEPSLGFGHVSE